MYLLESGTAVIYQTIFKSSKTLIMEI